MMVTLVFLRSVESYVSVFVKVHAELRAQSTVDGS